jgi:hypothetical protein
VSAPRLSPEAVALRRLLIEALYVEGVLGYVTPDRFLGRCPLCGGHVAVRFAGAAPRAGLYCRGGCAESEIAARLGLRARP